MANLLYSLHDRAAFPFVPSGGWLVESLALADNPVPTDYLTIRADINWIIRLNHQHNGMDGTIPLRPEYPEFAKRCVEYVMRQRGAFHFIIGNEPNHLNERPNGQPITPEAYGDCFNLCYQLIKEARPAAQVLTAAVAPWNESTGDWLDYFKRMLNRIIECDGLALHGYTHGAGPDLIYNYEKVKGWCWHFPILYQTIAAIPSKFAHLPVHATETNQGDGAWADVNSGWVQNAYQSVDEHNKTFGMQKVHSLTLYRWETHRDDKWHINDKPGVIADFNAAVARGYRSPVKDLLPIPPKPDIPPPLPPPVERREINPRLVARGVHLEPAVVSPGQPYWRATKLEWHPDAASTVGPDHHILGNVLRDGIETGGVPLKVIWPSDSTRITSKADDPNASYNYDYGMSPSMNEFSIKVDDGLPSDYVSGIGMGITGNDHAHTSTWITWEYKIAAAEPGSPPGTGVGRTMYVTPLIGANLRDVPNGETILVSVPYREAVDVYGMQAGSDGFEWSQTVWMDYSGWIRSDLLSAIQPDEIIPEPPEPPLPESGDLYHPLRRSIITQHWGQGGDAYLIWQLWGHDGCDFGGRPQGEPIACMADGVVVHVDYDEKGYGNWVEIAHDHLGVSTVYCHCQSILVDVGQVMQRGETIALLGTTGNSSGVHLHLEVRLINKDGTYKAGTPQRNGRVDPETWCILHGLKL